ncbi:MAG: PhzF family phenazine biosynthesis protein [Candidatus Thorarchaeota archaeon]|nr:PhzF family phenazine biosynthesis protein [Candidatus Thorarchaeota archaeon]MCK5237960.1 PhzF family phenazine biosynthesis protein [Candidatus Thorarchaeota archaeon]
MRKHELKFIHVDAFTDVPYGGNPAGVVLGADNLNDEQIHKIARELNVRETVFVSGSYSADYRFRYMSPTGEVDFSGHATIAAFHALIEEGLAELSQDVTMFSLETHSGVLQVDIVKNETTDLHEVQITHEKPEFLATYDSVEYAEALGLNLVDIMSLYPIQTVNTGLPTLMVPVISLDALKKVKPDWDKLDELSNNADYVAIQVFTKEANEVTSDAHARHFAPALGVREDSVTGAAAGCQGSYMVHYGWISSINQVTSIVIEQGHFMNRPGKVIVEVQGTQNNIQQVKVSGTAVTVIKGTIVV